MDSVKYSILIGMRVLNHCSFTAVVFLCLLGLRYLWDNRYFGRRCCVAKMRFFVCWQSTRHTVLHWDPAPPRKRGASPQFLANVCCGQTAGWIKMPLGTEVGLGPGDVVLDMGTPLPQKWGTATPHYVKMVILLSCSFYVYVCFCILPRSVFLYFISMFVFMYPITVFMLPT